MLKGALSCGEKKILDNLRARNPFFLCPASCLFPSKRVDPLVSVVQYIMRLPFEITLYVGDKKTTSHTDMEKLILELLPMLALLLLQNRILGEPSY